MGDISFGAKIQVFDAATNPFFHLGLAFVPSMTLPTGRESIFFGDANVTGQLMAVGDLEWLDNRIYLNLGTRFREKETIGNVTIGHEFLYGLGFQRPIVKRLDLNVIGEIFGATYYGNYFSDEESLPVEFLGLLQKKWWKQQLITQLGAGIGLTQGYGTPVFRLMGGVAYAFPVKKKE